MENYQEKTNKWIYYIFKHRRCLELILEIMVAVVPNRSVKYGGHKTYLRRLAGWLDEWWKKEYEYINPIIRHIEMGEW